MKLFLYISRYYRYGSDFLPIPWWLGRLGLEKSRLDNIPPLKQIDLYESDVLGRQLAKFLYLSCVIELCLCYLLSVGLGHVHSEPLTDITQFRGWI